LGAEKITHFYGCQMSTTNSVKQHKLRKAIADLSVKEGRGKEFISLYIPQKTSIDEAAGFLKKESVSRLERDIAVKGRLQGAIKEVIHHLKQHDEISLNGLAIFAGASVTNDLESEILSVQEIVPPEPLSSFLFEVDHHFRLEPLREMLRDQRVVGLIALETKEASFGILNGERLDLLETITSGIPGKTAKGGQSQRRFEREREMEVTYFFHRIAEHATKAFLENHKVNALIVGGPGQTKNDFLNGDFLHYELKNALLSIVDTQTAGKEGVREVFNKSCEILNNMCGPEEKAIMQRFLAELGKQNGLAVCGLDAVLDGLKKGAVEVALLIDNSDLTEIVATCRKCGLPKTEIADKKRIRAEQEMISRPCERCSAVGYTVEERDMVDVLEDAASRTDARVEVISSESEEKAKLAAFGGFAALMRYRQS